MDDDVKLCAGPKCKRPAKGKGRYCSDSCRAKASHARNFRRVNPTQYMPWYGPLCWCGRPGRYPENGRPKCGNHNLTRRADKERWRKVFRELQAKFTLEQLKELISGKADFQQNPERA